MRRIPMIKAMPVLAGFGLLLLTVVPASAQAQVDALKAQPAWCGGSYSVTGNLDAAAFHEAAAQNAVPSGTNFGECVPIEIPVRGLQGQSMISVQTYPASPASQVVFDGDRTYLLTVDGDGKE